MQELISADAGTSGIKVALVEASGKILASSVQSYPSTVQGSRAEQDPRDWWTGFRKALEELGRQKDLRKAGALVLSGQMQDLIPLVPGKEPDWALLYSDTRAREEWEALAEDPGREYLERTTANLGDPSVLPAKIRWLRTRHPERLSGDFRILLGAHDYLAWRLTGRVVTDYTNASTTGLLAFRENRWDRQILEAAGISVENLPELEPAARVTGGLTTEAAAELGLPSGLPVIHGAGDAGAATVGDGAGTAGTVSCYLGTSGWVSATGTAPVSPSLGIYNLRHPDPEQVIHIGAMSLTGGNTDWALRNLIRRSGPDTGEAAPAAAEWEEFSRLAGSAAPGSGGVFYLPYLMGERSPFRDPDARGAFIGLRKDSRREEMCRAVLEGVAYALGSILEVMDSGREKGRHLRLSGGGAANPQWRRILSGVTGGTVGSSPAARETGVLGNVIIAANALGWHQGWDLPGSFLAGERRESASPEEQEFYRRGRKIFSLMYPALKDVFHQIGQWNAE